MPTQLPTPINILEGDAPSPVLILQINGSAVDLNNYTNIRMLLKKSKWGADGEGPTLTVGSGLAVTSAATGEIQADLSWAQVDEFRWYVVRADLVATGKPRGFGFGPFVVTNV